MNALHLTLFVSAVLVVGWLAAFFTSVKQRDHDHSARTSLLPLQDDELVVDASDAAVAGASLPSTLQALRPFASESSR